MAMYKGGKELVKLQDQGCYIPTEDEIKREAAAIRAGWTEHTRESRLQLRESVPVPALEPITITFESGQQVIMSSMRPRI